MVRHRKRKTDRAGVPADIMKKAATEVRQGISVRSAAKANSINPATLRRYCKALQKLKENGSSEEPHVGYQSRRVFSEAQEELLTEYLKEAADQYNGITPREVRRFAYHLAVDNNCKHPLSWDEKSMAGSDWFSCFRKRHPNLPIRSSSGQPTSLLAGPKETPSGKRKTQSETLTDTPVKLAPEEEQEKNVASPGPTEPEDQEQSFTFATTVTDTTCKLETSVEEDEEDEQNEEPPALADGHVQPSGSGSESDQPSERKSSSTTEDQAQDLASMLKTLNESIKGLTSLQSTPPPPPPDNITLYCKYLEGELRAITDPQQLHNVMFQFSQILNSYSSLSI